MSITTRQNEPNSIDLLAAQRQLYTDAKRARRVRMLGSVGIAAASPFIVLFSDQAGKWLGAAAGAWIVLSRVVLRPAEQRRSALGAAAQEEFDTYVLGLPWNDSRRPRPSAHRISSATRRYFRRSNRGRRLALTDWYSDPQTAKPPYDVLLCQLANLSWSARLHGEWTNLMGAAIAIWIVLGVVVGQLEGLSLLDYLVALLLPSLPAAIDVLDAHDAHRRHVAKRDEAEARAAQLWEEGVSGRSTASIADCRLIQDAIWELREEPIVVPDWYYRLRRKAFEADMQSVSDRLIEEARRSGLA
jgi:SMODS-associating 4TM effector domain